MTTGLNISGTVLLDLAAKADFNGEVLFVDTGFHFPETLEYWDHLSKRYPGIKFIKLNTEAETGFLFETDPIQCCEINKVTPLEDYLSKKTPSALLNARTRDSAAGRKSLSLIENGNPIKINPLITMTRRDLEQYVIDHNISTHPLYKDGFLSMGCWPCTKAVRPGEDPRSGRFVGQSRTECGIWGTIGAVSNK